LEEDTTVARPWLKGGAGRAMRPFKLADQGGYMNPLENLQAKRTGSMKGVREHKEEGILKAHECFNNTKVELGSLIN
jgi:hypothetical protein